jgi:hypothetical protein
MLKQFILSAALLITGIFIVADFDGSWQGKVKTPDGTEIDLTYNLKADGEKLTGAVVTQWGENAITDGKIKGDEFSFSQSFDQMQFKHSGKVSGDSMFVKIVRDDNPAIEAVLIRSKK